MNPEEMEVTRHDVPYPSLEEALAQVPDAPAAVEEPEPVTELSELERLMNGLGEVQEGQLYSSNVQRAIDVMADVQTMQDAIQAIRENSGFDFKHYLFRQIDEETRDLDRFMHELQNVPALPSLDVDFI